MQTKVLASLRRRMLRETTLTHVAVLLGIGALSSALAVGILKDTASVTPTQPTIIAASEPTAQVDAVLESEPSTGSYQSAPVSARGDRPVSPPTSAAAAIVMEPAARAETTAPPAPTLAADPTAMPVATPKTAPTAAPKPPTPTAAPPAPTPQPTQAPAVRLSALSQLRVGLQAGHWKNSELPAELAVLRGSTGAAGSGWREVDVNLAVAQKTAAILRDRGIVVDLIPATVPVAYKADAFLSIHGDANGNTGVSGYKLARASWSKIPQQEDALVRAVSAEYAAASGLKEHPNTITANMRQYYAFNWRSFQHAVASTTPSAILELGFLTTASDRKLMLEEQDRLAEGIANGIIRFLTGE